MAQIINKKSIHMDMTPLVDLAFLLLTFFVLTATFSNHFKINLNFPSNAITMPICTKANGMTIFINNNEVSYKVGNIYNRNNPLSHSSNLINEIASIKKQFELKNQKLFVVILPDKLTSYQKVIDIIDALSINDISAYSIQEVSK